ncbi:hypothetical protein [Neobacillus niacini]|nr:hypothetical protein [Neobacillus niacini]
MPESVYQELVIKADSNGLKPTPYMVMILTQQANHGKRTDIKL